MARINKAKARDELHQAEGIDFSANVYTLSHAQLSALADKAREVGYRKPKNANASTGNYFFAYLNKPEGK